MSLRDEIEEEWDSESWKLGVNDVSLKMDDDDHRSLVQAVAMAQRILRIDGESLLPPGKGDLQARYLGEICRHYIECMTICERKAKGGDA
jgi:hypothetical protein